MPQIYIDFYGRENRTCTRKLLLDLIQTSKLRKTNDISNKTYISTGHEKIKAL